MNPEKAHICKMEDYKWSSYGEYLDGRRTADMDPFHVLFPAGASAIQRLPRRERNILIERLSDAGLTAAQICQIADLGKNIV